MMRPEGKIKYTQGQISQVAGTSQPSVARWLDGESMPDGRQLGALADFFGCTVDALLGREGEMPPIAGAMVLREMGQTTLVEEALNDIAEARDMLGAAERKLRRIKHA